MNRIKELRKNKLMTQTDLAKICNTTTSNISGWECEKWQPDYKTLIILADFFGVSVDYLLGRDELPQEEVSAGAMLTRKEDITPKEDELLYGFRKLSSGLQDVVLLMVQTFNGEKPEIEFKRKP